MWSEKYRNKQRDQSPKIITNVLYNICDVYGWHRDGNTVRSSFENNTASDSKKKANIRA